MRNDLATFNKRPNSLLRTWLGERKAKKPKNKITNQLFKHKALK